MQAGQRKAFPVFRGRVYTAKRLLNPKLSEGGRLRGCNVQLRTLLQIAFRCRPFSRLLLLDKQFADPAVGTEATRMAVFC